jgi:hypothetical protein
VFKITKAIAKQKEKQFWCSDGWVLRNLPELVTERSAITRMRPEVISMGAANGYDTYLYH